MRRKKKKNIDRNKIISSLVLGSGFVIALLIIIIPQITRSAVPSYLQGRLNNNCTDGSEFGQSCLIDEGVRYNPNARGCAVVPQPGGSPPSPKTGSWTAATFNCQTWTWDWSCDSPKVNCSNSCQSPDGRAGTEANMDSDPEMEGTYNACGGIDMKSGYTGCGGDVRVSQEGQAGNFPDEVIGGNGKRTGSDDSANDGKKNACGEVDDCAGGYNNCRYGAAGACLSTAESNTIKANPGEWCTTVGQVPDACGNCTDKTYYNVYRNPDVDQTGEIKITGDIRGSSLTARGLSTAPAKSDTGEGRIYFDSTTNTFKVSANGGAYSVFGSGGGSSQWTDIAGGGVFYNNKVGIGTNVVDTTAKLLVSGQIKITGGAPGAGKVLTSDANGLASWQALPASSVSQWSGITDFPIACPNGKVVIGVGTTLICAPVTASGVSRWADVGASGIRYDGSVGMGKNPSGARLDLEAAATDEKGIQIAGNNSYEIYLTGAAGNIGAEGNLYLLAGTTGSGVLSLGSNNSINQVVIDNGKVGIGVTDLSLYPAQSLGVAGGIGIGGNLSVGGGQINLGTNGVIKYNNSNGAFVFSTNKGGDWNRIGSQWDDETGGIRYQSGEEVRIGTDSGLDSPDLVLIGGGGGIPSRLIFKERYISGTPAVRSVISATIPIAYYPNQDTPPNDTCDGSINSKYVCTFSDNGKQCNDISTTPDSYEVGLYWLINEKINCTGGGSGGTSGGFRYYNNALQFSNNLHAATPTWTNLSTIVGGGGSVNSLSVPNCGNAGQFITSSDGATLTCATPASSGILGNVAGKIGAGTFGLTAGVGDTFGGGNYIFKDATNKSDVLFIDALNKRVGVGTGSPSELFDVGGGKFLVDSTGRIGIGIAPMDKVQLSIYNAPQTSHLDTYNYGILSTVGNYQTKAFTVRRFQDNTLNNGFGAISRDNFIVYGSGNVDTYGSIFVKKLQIREGERTDTNKCDWSDSYVNTYVANLDVTLTEWLSNVPGAQQNKKGKCRDAVGEIYLDAGTHTLVADIDDEAHIKIGNSSDPNLFKKDYLSPQTISSENSFSISSAGWYVIYLRVANNSGGGFIKDFSITDSSNIKRGLDWFEVKGRLRSRAGIFPKSIYDLNIPGEAIAPGAPPQTGTSGGGCFLAGIKVRMFDGSYKEIQEIKEGEYILSYNVLNKTQSVSRVNKLLIHPDIGGGYFVINNKIKVTGNHLMWIVSRNKWDRVDTLQIGDTLLDPSSKSIKISSIKKVDGVNTVYNLELSHGDHDYFAEDVLAHNFKPDTSGDPSLDVPGGF